MSEQTDYEVNAMFLELSCLQKGNSLTCSFHRLKAQALQAKRLCDPFATYIAEWEIVEHARKTAEFIGLDLDVYVLTQTFVFTNNAAVSEPRKQKLTLQQPLPVFASGTLTLADLGNVRIQFSSDDLNQAAFEAYRPFLKV